VGTALTIPYGRQQITDEDIQTVVDVLSSELLTQGPVVPQFEQDICNYTCVKYAVAVNSGTSALHLACLALGLSKGDWLWTTPISFVASANCGLYCGARIDFVDIDPGTWNISITNLEKKLIEAKKHNRLPKVLVAVHLCGLSCDMEAISLLSKKYGFYVIEDASHAIGGIYKGNPIGKSLYSDITVFSFHPVKTITTGEGGMALTNEKKLANTMRLLRSHGITRNKDEMTHEPDGPWYYQQIDLGFNYRLTDIQAALGISQLKRLNTFIEIRHKLRNRYDSLLANLPVQTQFQPQETKSGMHLYVIRIQTDKISMTHQKVFTELRTAGVGVNLHYIPIHLQPYYQRFGFKKGDFPEAEKYYEQAITLPLYPDLNETQIEEIVKLLTRILH